jgi:PAS domain S-box-containing protein
VTEVVSSLRPKLKSWLNWIRHYLYPYRPLFRNKHFWIVQGLVLGIAALHDIIEAEGFLPHLGALYFVPISLFFIPVVYAAVYFGFAGAFATVLWATTLTIPNWVFWHHGLERWGDIFEMFVLNSLALFVGWRVDLERRNRQQAEAAEAERRVSEMKYRDLFEAAVLPVLVLDDTGAVLDANPAAGKLFNKDTDNLKTMVLTDLVGMENARKVLSRFGHGKEQVDSVALTLNGKPQVFLESTLIKINDSHGNAISQLILRDITEELNREASRKAYTAFVIRAQEEERQRIARELHDQTIQALSLHCRQLDMIEMSIEPLSNPAIHELQKARRDVEEIVDGLREFATGLRPPALDNLGVVASIRRLVEDIEDRTNMKAQIKAIGEPRRLPPDVELGIFRIAQEALLNVERHARSTKVTVTMTFTEQAVKLDIVDDGVGFTTPPQTTDFISTHHLGIIGMHERAALLGGNLCLQSSPGKGTRVIFTVKDYSSLSNINCLSQQTRQA